MATKTGWFAAGDIVADRVLTRARLAAGGIARLWRAWENRRAAARYLGGADERMLHDIGLTASDVDAAFSGPIWRDPTEHLGRVQRGRRNS